MDPRLSAPSVARNREPSLAALRPLLPAIGLLLEIASGSGEHAAHLAAALPRLTVQPSDPTPDARASIDAWCGTLTNVRPAIDLDAAAPSWPIMHADAILCVNMIHIAPWAATQGLLAGAARVLMPGGVLVLYGPFLQRGVPTAPGNLAFDADLRARDPAWGVRALEDVERLAAGFAPPEVTPMPANNLLVAFRKRAA